MTATRRALAVAAVALGCVAAFFAGGDVGARATVASSARAATPAPAVAVAPTATSATRPTGDVTRLGRAIEDALRPHAAAGAPAQAYVETPEQRAERHRTLHRKISETLGEVTAEKRAALIELNDEATQVQFGLQAAVLSGTLTQTDYDAQLHQRVLVQLEQLRGIVTDDEYRKLTGLEPGVDPYDFMRTGTGAARTAAVAAEP